VKGRFELVGDRRLLARADDADEGRPTVALASSPKIA
jgi:hypothetical protein